MCLRDHICTVFNETLRGRFCGFFFNEALRRRIAKRAPEHQNEFLVYSSISCKKKNAEFFALKKNQISEYVP